ncbi:MAG: M1 family metallopeptidase [Bacteroidota bacterium]
MKKSFLFAALLTVVGCIPRYTQHDFEPDSEITDSDQNTETQINVNDKVRERPVYRATETVFTDLITTKLEVSFDWNKAQLIGKETLTAKPHFYASDKLVLDAKGMEIKSVTMNGAARPYTYEKDILTITLDKTYQRTENYTVVIDYIAKPDERTLEGSAAITSDKGLYFINPRGEDPNKMPQVWTQGETEASSVWFPTIDAPNVKTKQEMLITVEDKYATLSNGKFLGSKKNADGTRTDHWKQDLPHAPYLFMMGVGGFKVVKDSYKRADGTLMDVNYYVEPEWEQYAKDIFGETPKMIEFFSKLMDIDYQWDKYDQIIVRDYVSGAMENTGAVVFGDYAYKTRRELIDGNDNSTIAHELFHHWFGDLVTAESWSNLTLNESFANYSQYLWDEYRYGIDEADLNANSEMEIYFQSATMGGVHDLFHAEYQDKEDMFDAHSYNKGGRILHMLRNYLGDEAFFEGMQLYLKTNKFKAAEFHQLRLAFEEVSGEDLHWFFDQWYEASGHPLLDVNYTVANGMVTVDVAQTQYLNAFPVFRLPLDVVVFDDNGATTHRIDIDKSIQQFELPYTGTLKNVLFDNQAMVLAQVKEKKESSWYVHQYYNGKRWRARRDGLNNGIKERTPEAFKMVLDALDDPFWDIRLTAIEKVGFLSGADKTIAFEKIKQLAQNDPSSAVRSSAISALSAALSETEAMPIMERAVQSDSSYMVITNALNQLSKMNPQSAMKLAKPLENERSSSMMAGIAALYARHGKADQYAFFERILSSNILQGFDQVGGLYSFSAFLIGKDLPLFAKSMKIYEDKAKNGDMYSKMYLGNYLDQLTAHLEERIVEFKEEEEKQKRAGNVNGMGIAKANQVEAQELIKQFKRIALSVEQEEGH